MRDPDQRAIVIGIALGHPDPDSPQDKFKSTKRKLKEVVSFVGF